MNRNRISVWATALALALVAPAIVKAQDTAKGGVTGAANNVSDASKSVGRGAKGALKSVGSATHHVLKTAGRNTKAGLKKITGDTMPKDPNHKPGGLNKVARDVSGAGKKVGRAVKSGVHEGASDAHKSLQKTGNDIKATNKDTTH